MEKEFEAKDVYTVLIIDDDVEITDLIKTMLNTNIHQTEVSFDGK